MTKTWEFEAYKARVIYVSRPKTRSITIFPHDSQIMPFSFHLKEGESWPPLGGYGLFSWLEMNRKNEKRAAIWREVLYQYPDQGNQ